MHDLRQGDCREVMRGLDADSIDAIVTDPPYGLEFMGKDWDGANGFRRALNKADVGRESVFGRSSRTSPEYRAGHLYQEWSETWAIEAFRVLKPGGHLLAFGGSRTYHRMVCAIEDAGFEIRDQIMWVYGSGFPKSRDVSKAMDAEAGAEREVIGEGNPFGRGSMRNRSRVEAGYRPTELNPNGGTVALTAPATDLARQWQGWGTALKPAHEPIVVARKPLQGTVAANVAKWGTGALNIDGCRVDSPVYDSERRTSPTTGRRSSGFAMGGMPEGERHNPAGRWPANLIHDGSDEVLAAFAAFGKKTSRAFKRTDTSPAATGRNGIYGHFTGAPDGAAWEANTGTAARFFKSCEMDRYCALSSVLLTEETDIIQPLNMEAGTWANVQFAEVLSDLDESSAQGGAQVSLLPEQEDRSARSARPARSVEKSLKSSRETSESIAQQSATRKVSELLARVVKSAASLSDLCATDIALKLVALRRGLSPASHRSRASINERSEQILNRSLALYVAGRESTVTILTTASLKQLFGSVLPAIEESTSSGNAVSAVNTEFVPTRFRYESKASKADRDAGLEGMPEQRLRDGIKSCTPRAYQINEQMGRPDLPRKNTHPTVKPTALMRYLCRLVCPPGGTILDPFMGSGSTGRGAVLEGFSFIGIETDPDYITIAERRIAHAEAERAPDLFSLIAAE